MPIPQHTLALMIRDALEGRYALDFVTGQAEAIPLPSAVLSPLRDLLDHRLPSELQGYTDEPANKNLEFLESCTFVQDGVGPTVTVSASTLRQIIRDHMCAAEGQTGRSAEAKVLYLRNLAIEGDLDLSGLVIDGSIKLVCCAIRGAVRLVHTELQSCEFSGSVCNTFEASYITIKGSLRARRSMFLGLVDLGAAKIGGVLDLMDCLAIPIYMPSPSGVRVPQRGILNLALAQIDHDIRLNRAQIFGHIMMNGASIGNCIFTDHLFVSSISNVVRISEVSKVISGTAPYSSIRLTPPSSYNNASIRSVHQCEWCRYTCRMDDEALLSLSIRQPNTGAAAQKWLQDWVTQISKFRALRLHTCLKLLSGINSINPESSLLELLKRNKQDTQREAISAIGIRVGGTITGRGTTFLGSIIFDHSRMEGGISFEGLTIDGNPNRPEDIANHEVIPCKVSLTHIEAKRSDIKFKGQPGSSPGLPASDPLNLCCAKFDLSNSIVGGSVSISGFTFASGSPTRQTPLDGEPTLKMSYAQIGGGVAIRRTQNLDGIRAPGITTAGSFRMMDLAKFNRDEDKYEDFIPEHNNISGTIGLSDASIGRDLVLVFDRESGPTLDLTGIKVSSRLAILPAQIRDKDKLIAEARKLEACKPSRLLGFPGWFAGRVRADTTDWLHAKLFKGTVPSNSEFDCEHVTLALLRLIAAEARIIREGVEARMRGNNWGFIQGRYPAAEELLARWFGSSQGQLLGPRIQLRQASAGMLVHPPTAWPRFGEMRLEGFQYSLVDSMGPLAPIRRRLNSHATATSASRPYMILLTVVSTCTCLYIALSHLNWLPKEADLAILSEIYNRIGRTVTTALALLLTLSLTWLLSHLLFPPSSMGTPLAVHWLKLQGGRPSVYRNVGWFGSLGSYLQAARVLRAAGRRNSAAETEYARLRLRERMLSWRNHWPVKLLSQTVDLISGYGFRPARAIVIFLLLMMGGGATANQIFACGGATPLLIDTWKPDPVLAGLPGKPPKRVTQSVAPPTGAALGPNGEPTSRPRDAALVERPNGLTQIPRGEAKLPRDERGFSGLAYALDRYLPGYDGGELQRWSLGNRWVDVSNEAHCLHQHIRTGKTERDQKSEQYAQKVRADLTNLRARDKDQYNSVIRERVNFLALLNRILDYIGLTLIAFIAILAVSVTARVESLLTRPEES